ncbi:AAA family ATPase [Guptibacillus hwajinpoensis]|uniref:Protein CR006 P-loop domain-containing protein n=1 Tax=Guptibacillus hwajinpoensis TaxID=208199 RepID=A0A0J6CT31_9BACL|nr:AAA family ATPase [Alkalihalobacillus macyae]KMM36353.1 hypothetical protein AB986_18105 [Alkalihalobacillus macyae]
MNLHNEIWSWSSTLPEWQNDLVRRLYEKKTLSSEELELVADNILFEFGVITNNTERSKLEKKHIPDKQNSEAVKIDKLNNFENIAAIDSDNELKFSLDGLTVIYGDNSAGKSSYAKVLKQACRAVDNNVKIHPNIYTEEEYPGRAQIHIQNPDKAYQVINRVPNTPPEPVLSTISTFDTDCAKVYAESENKVVFIPTELNIFDSLANHQSKLKDSLEGRKEPFLKKLPDLTHLVKDHNLKKFFESISYKTKEKEIEDYCTFTREDSVRLDQVNEDLQLVLSNDPQKAIRELERKIREVELLKKDIHSIREVLSEETLQSNQSIYQEYLDVQESLAILSQEAFVQQPLSGVGSSPWKNLWNAALEFNKIAYPESDFPNVDDEARCLLCQQELDKDAKARFATFHEFISNNLSKRAKVLKRKQDGFLTAIRSLPIDKVENSTIRSYLYDENPNIEIQIEKYIRAANSICSTFLEPETDRMEQLPTLEEIAPTLEQLDQWVITKKSELNRKQELTKKNNKEDLMAEKNHLYDKKTAHENINLIKEILPIKKNLYLIEEAIKTLDTTKLTRKYNELANEFLTDQFKETIDEELRALRCDNVLFNIKSRGTKGKTSIRLTLDTDTKVNLSDVLSEGERKALSLAFFLAEISALPTNGGIILDDPVSSLDQGRREYVAHRLIKESNKRQVIIFTHDIVFLHTLQKYAKLYGIDNSCCTVRRIGNRAGIAKTEFPWVAQPIKSRIKYLKNELPKLKKMEQDLDPDIYYKEVKTFYMLLREGWERAVEELMIGGVVERFDASVKTQRLREAKISEELIEKVNAGMTKSSMMVHDESSAIGRITPSIEEIQEDLDHLEVFYKEFR